MPSQQHTCAYIKCKKKFYGTKSAKYCSPKCGTYQRRLDYKDDGITLGENKQKGKMVILNFKDD